MESNVNAGSEEGGCYLHVNNGGMLWRLCDNGQGPSFHLQYTHLGKAQIEERFEIEPSAVHELRWLFAHAFFQPKEPLNGEFGRTIPGLEELSALRDSIELVNTRDPERVITVGWEIGQAFLVYVKRMEHEHQTSHWEIPVTHRDLYSIATCFDDAASKPAYSAPRHHNQYHVRKTGMYSQEDMEAVGAGESPQGGSRQRARAVALYHAWITSTAPEAEVMESGHAVYTR